MITKKSPEEAEKFNLQEKLVTCFNNGACLGLIDRPQVFVILSCRGEKGNTSSVDHERVLERNDSINLASGLPTTKVPTVSDR